MDLLVEVAASWIKNQGKILVVQIALVQLTNAHRWPGFDSQPNLLQIFVDVTTNVSYLVKLLLLVVCCNTSYKLLLKCD